MKGLAYILIALEAATSLAAGSESDVYPLAIDPGTGIPWTTREIGIDHEAEEHELIATVAGFLAGKFLQVHGKWPSSPEELLSTIEERERAKAREWFEERIVFSFTPRGEELKVACQKLAGPKQAKIIVLLERASTAEEVMKKMKMKKDGEPGATDNPGDAQ